MSESPLDLEMAASTMTARLRRSTDDIVDRLKYVCPETSRLHSAAEFRAVARSLQLAADHILGNADALEASHAD